MLRNKSRLLGYLAPIALVAFLSLPQVFAQKPTVVSAVLIYYHIKSLHRKSYT